MWKTVTSLVVEQSLGVTGEPRSDGRRQRQQGGEQAGGPEPLKERPRSTSLSPWPGQGWSQSPDLGAFVSTSAFHESFHASCQIRRKGGSRQSFPSPEARQASWGTRRRLLEPGRVGGGFAGEGLGQRHLCLVRQGPVGPLAPHNGFLKAQGVTFKTEELPKIKRPWGHCCLCFF